MFEYQRVSLRDLEGIHGATLQELPQKLPIPLLDASRFFPAFEVSSAWKLLPSHYIILYTPSHLPFNLLHQSIIVTTNLYQLNSAFIFPRSVPRFAPHATATGPPPLPLFFVTTSSKASGGSLRGKLPRNPQNDRALRGAVNSKQCFLGRICDIRV